MLVFFKWYQLGSIHCKYYGSNCCVAAIVCFACEDVLQVSVLCWCFYCGISSEAFIVSNIATTAL